MQRLKTHRQQNITIATVTESIQEGEEEEESSSSSVHSNSEEDLDSWAAVTAAGANDAITPTTNPLASLGSTTLSAVGNDDNNGPTTTTTTTTTTSKLIVQGCLCYKKGKHAGGSRRWKRGFVVLNLQDGGTIQCFKNSTMMEQFHHQHQQQMLSLSLRSKISSTKQQQQQQQKHFDSSKRSRNSVLTTASKAALPQDKQQTDDSNHFTRPDLEIKSSIQYVVKDIANDLYRFLVEIYDNNDDGEPDGEEKEQIIKSPSSLTGNASSSQPHNTSLGREQAPGIKPHHPSSKSSPSSFDKNKWNVLANTSSWQKALDHSKRNGKPLRLYFKCSQLNEKTLWLTAFQRLGRLQEELRPKKGWNAVTSFTLLTRRKRLTVGQQFIQDSRILMDEAGRDSLCCFQERTNTNTTMMATAPSTAASSQQNQSTRIIATTNSMNAPISLLGSHHMNNDFDNSSRLVRMDGTNNTNKNTHGDKNDTMSKDTDDFSKDMLSSTADKSLNDHDDGDNDSNSNKNDPSPWRWRKNSHAKDTEYLVEPSYAYPNRWMTSLELHTEMLKPSSAFHDLRLLQPTTTTTTKKETINNINNKTKEIGTLHVEVLQCLGLKKLDLASATDAVVYLVCGSYAFATDTIWNRQNPVWLCKTRRACIFPLFDGFARLYVGVFDDDGKFDKDDFAGRIVLDLARCRPQSTYDVTMPLRSSAHVYATRRLGAIRLRFRIDWHSQRDALLSYIPKELPTASRTRNNLNDLTVICADAKSFRNVAITVHGHHLPGSFSLKHMRATMLEINFTQQRIFRMMETLVYDIILWRIPRLSLLIWTAWMHSVYTGRFSLVPAYCFLFLSLCLMNNYFDGYISIANGQLQDNNNTNGFVPPSWEEMFMALLCPKLSSGIQPLEMKVEKGPNPKIESHTHQPRGLCLYRLLTGKYGSSCSSSTTTTATKINDNDDDKNNNENTSQPLQFYNEMEFPFSQGLGYKKVNVADSLATITDTITGKVISKQHQHKLGYYGVADSNFRSSSTWGNIVEESDDDSELHSDFSRVFADTLGYNCGIKGAVHNLEILGKSSVQKAGELAENGINFISHAAESSAMVMRDNTKLVGKGVVHVAGSGISKLGKGAKKVGKTAATVAGAAVGTIGTAASRVSFITDSGIDKMGIKKVGRTLGSVADSSIDKVGLKKVGKAVGTAAGTGLSTIGVVAETGIKTVGKKTKVAGKVVVNTAGRAVKTTKKAGQAATKKASGAVGTVGDAAGAGISKIGMTTYYVVQAIKNVLSESRDHELPCDCVDREAQICLRGSYPEQNVDVKVKTTSQKKSLADELANFKDSAHRCSFHVFNDRTHIVRNPNACYFGEAKRSEPRKLSSVRNELDRLLNTGAYSNTNPLIAYIGVYLEPMVSAALSFLCPIRSIHNVFTWQDPMLSFMVSLLLFGITAIFFVFPWRLFFFLAGLLLLGPQNWILRKIYELGKCPHFFKHFVNESESKRVLEMEQNEGHLSPFIAKNNGENANDNGTTNVLPTNQPIICAPEGDDRPFRQVTIDDVDPREVHEVSVPYSRFMHHRFYDWPPESQYCRVESHQ